MALFANGAGVFTSGQYFDGSIGGGMLRERGLVLDYPERALYVR